MITQSAMTPIVMRLPSLICCSASTRTSSEGCDANPNNEFDNASQPPEYTPRQPSNSSSATYSVAEVLSVAKIHPFYSLAEYPPDGDTVVAAREKAATSPKDVDLKAQPLLRKKDLYNVIERLVNDTSARNTYRHSVYTSITGGGSATSKPLFFATDTLENRRQRACFGNLLRKLGMIKRGDWVLTVHYTGDLYRSLDLTCEVMENAGASVLAAGNHLPLSKVVQLLQDFSVNVLTGDGSQVISVVHYISTLTTGREKIILDKIIYTSDALSVAQRNHIYEVLGPVEICSFLGSAEAGPYGASSPSLTPREPSANHADFIIDTRMTLIEILPLSAGDGDADPDSLPEGETGLIVQTSLTRLRNPLVRYVTGDVGSLHPLSDRAKSLIAEADMPYLRVLRLQGRDRRFSFSWDGLYVELSSLSSVMADPELGVLQWQIILANKEPSKEVSLEFRVLSSQGEGTDEGIVKRLKDFFYVQPSAEHKFGVKFVDNVGGFVLSETGRKVIRVVDRCN